MADDLPDAPWATGGAGGAELPDAPWATGHQYGAVESGLEGYLKGASANWRDEIYGASKASGLPDWLGGLRAPIGAGRLAYERFTQPKSITGLVTGDTRGPVQREYERARDEKRRQEEEMQRQHPYAFGAGELGGAGLSMLGAPEIAPARMLAGPLGRAGAAMASGAGYGAVSGAGEAATPQEMLPEAAKSAAVGTVLGGAGSAAAELVTPLVRKASSLYHGMADPEAEAVRRYARAAAADAAGTGARLSPQDIALAQHVGMPIAPIDTSGQAVRELGRTAANFSPEAQTALKEFTQNRFEEQSPRIAGFIRHITGGADAAIDTGAIQEAGRLANRPAYRAAYAAGDQPIWSPELERLSASPTVLNAMRGAQSKWKDWQIIDGYGSMNPPVKIAQTGTLQFLPGKGLQTAPNIQFWDYTARVLAGKAQQARKAGNMQEAARYGGLEKALKSELDKVVPEFGQARQGAAGFFGADNALKAGHNFVRPPAALSPKDELAQRNAIKRMSPGEKELFARGYASRLAAEVERVGVNRDVLLKDFFNSGAGQARTRLALGPGRAQQLEALLRVEGLVDQSRKVLGNSTTARQMIAAAVFGAGGDYAVEGHFDPTHMVGAALAGASFPHAYQQVGQLVSRRVAAQLGHLLTSQNPVDLAKGAKIASRDAAIMRRLRQLTAGGIPGAGTAAGTELLHQKPGQGFKHGGPVYRASGGRVNPANIDHNPSEAQKKAGNYAKDHVSLHGLDIAIENAKGKKRHGVDRDGKPWSVVMPAHYGYIKRTTGKDGDHVDVYLGPHLKAPRVYVIDQRNADSRKFDEHKAFLGFGSAAQVRATYRKAFSDGRANERLGHLTEMSVDGFKNWLAEGDTTKPLKRAAGGRAKGGALGLDESLQGEIEDRRDEVPDFAYKPFMEYHPFHYSEAGGSPSVSENMPYWHRNELTGNIERIHPVGRAEGGSADEDDESTRLQANFARNSAWTQHGATDFNTRLGYLEPAFRQWVKNNNIPFDPKSRAPQDYDMRGFWKAMRSGDPIAAAAIDPNDSRIHYPDYWKTPYHETFSAESQWAAPNAPRWNEQDQLVTPEGQLLFDDRAPQPRTEGGPADAISEDQDEALSRSMTHYPEAPNPAQPYIQGTKDFLKGGLSQVLKGQGVQLPEWSNRVGDMLQSEAANYAMGMATPLKPRYYVADFFEKEYLKGQRFDSPLAAKRAAKSIPANENGVFIQRDDGDYLHTLSNPIENNPPGYVHDVIEPSDPSEPASPSITAYHGSPHDKDIPQGRATGGRIIGAKSQSEVGLAKNEPGTTFRCGTCKYFSKGACHNENPELKDRKVKPHWCCNLYDHAGMKVIA